MAMVVSPALASSEPMNSVASLSTPIGVLKDATEFIGSDDAKAGETTMAIREKLLGIQTGTVPDTHGWLTRLA